MSAIAIHNAQASEVGATRARLDKPAVNGTLAAKATSPSQETAVLSLQEKYAEERAKRVRAEGNRQFVKLVDSGKYKHLASDCWAEKDGSARLTLHDDMHAKVFVVGGGFGGLCYAIRMVQAGIKPEDIIIADAAGGYGGTWYWNRYPGLMCDVESYLYLPLLEETGYMPKHKYSYGSEIREYANLLAKKWHLEDRGAFRQQVDKLDWNDTDNCWQVQTLDLTTNKPIRLNADFVAVAPGLLHNPKLNEFDGIDKFQGHFFHTARWDYDYTGGSPVDTNMTKLKDKKVGLIGTGATAIQAVPHLARCSKELYVFQRTPSQVDRRDQRPTDPREFKEEITNQRGWQWERTKNYNSFLNNATPLPTENLVDDGWTNFPAYSALLGGPKEVTMENVADHIAEMHALDVPRSEAMRRRVEDIVTDKQTAEALKSWYPGWCKRPCFHDDYLPTFNRPNVHLIDTDGQGIDRLTQTGIVANNQQYDLDCIVFGTGYSIQASLSPTRRAGISAHGRNGRSLDEKWNGGVATLHGIMTNGFPNLFFPGPIQATASANFSSVLDLLARHAAYIVAQASGLHQSNSNSNSKSTSRSTSPSATDSDSITSPKVIIEPTAAAEEAWSQRCMAGAVSFAAFSGCTPSYLNAEGETDAMSEEQQMKAARSSMWGDGMNSFAEVIEAWREDGRLEGLKVEVVRYAYVI